MSNISDLSGDEREKRIAELKKKMQAAAAKTKAEHDAADGATKVEESADPMTEKATMETVVVAVAESTVASEADVASSASADIAGGAEETTASTDEPDVLEDVAAEAESEATEEIATPVAAAEAELVAAVYLEDERSEEDKLRAQMNRREFLTYTWGAATGLLLLGSGVATFQFMYPRFKAGEFGGAFLMGPESALPPAGASPQPVTDGKFWWINTEEERPIALFMVCTHLGCLYKWVEERYRFECPCHGSKFTREGLYIEGPAPRSLDTFATELVDGVWVVDTGAKINGAPASESPAVGTG